MNLRPLISTFALPARAQLHGKIGLRPIVVGYGARPQWRVRCVSSSVEAGKGHDSGPPLSAVGRMGKSIPMPTKSETTLSKSTTTPSRSTSTPSKPNVPAKRTTTPPSFNTSLPASEKLNPPSFTHPPDLSVPARKPGQNYASYLFGCGKAYLAFYKSGISHTRQTLKHAKTLRARLATQGHGASSPVAGAGILTRAEWQVLRRSKRDMLRLPVMAFLILALGEWLPVVVVYLTPAVPEACRIPAQLERAQRRREATRQQRLTALADSALALQARDRTPATDENAVRLAVAAEGVLSPERKQGKTGGIAMADAIVPPTASQEISLFHLLLLSARLDVHPRIFDWLHVTPPKWLLQRGVGNKLAYLVQDDELVQRDGGSQALGERELRRACEERGIDVLGKSEAELRKALGAWYVM